MFQNFYILYILIAALIPVLLHILNLQKVQSVEFSTLMFLKEIRKSKFRKIRIKDLILMLIRFSIIILLVFVFADPLINSSEYNSSNTVKYGLIFKDSSFSMSAIEDGRQLYSEKDSTSELIKSTFNSSDEINEITTSNDLSSNKPGINAILNEAKNRITEMNKRYNEIFIISDNQRNNFNNISNDLNADNAIYYFINVSNKIPANISINDVKVITKLPEKAKQIKISAIIKNYGSNLVSSNKLILLCENTIMDEKTFDINPQERKEIEFVTKIYRTGIIKFRFEMKTQSFDNDEFMQDNSYNFEIFIPDIINVGILNRNDQFKNLKYVFDAENNNSETEIYKYDIISDFNSIEKYDVLFISDFKDESEMSIIKNYLSEGKGIFIFPDKDLDLNNSNKLTNFHIQNYENISGEYRISDILETSPLFNGIFKKENIELSTEINPLKLSGIFNISVSDKSLELLTLNNLKLFLIEDRSNYGVILFSAVPLNPAYSDFNKNQLFAPLIIKSAYYLSYNKKFELFQDNNFQTLRDTLESNPERIDSKSLEKEIKNAGLKKYRIIEKEEIKNIKEIIENSRKGRSLWYYAVILLLILICGEIYYMRRAKND